MKYYSSIFQLTPVFSSISKSSRYPCQILFVILIKQNLAGGTGDFNPKQPGLFKTEILV